MVARTAAQVGDVIRAAHGRSAFKGVGFQPLLAVLDAPIGIEIVQSRGNFVGMAVTGTEDDRFLLRPAGIEQMTEKITAHRCNALRNQNLVFDLRRAVPVAQFILADGFASDRVGDVFAG